VRKKKTVIKAAQAAPARRVPLRYIVGIIVLLVGMAAWKAVATHSSKANSIAAASSPGPLPPATNFIPTIPNATPAPANTPDGMAWIPGGEFSMGVQNAPDMNEVGMQATTDSQPIHRL
jgi:hypothetical protein